MGLVNTLQFIINHPLNVDKKFSALSSFLKWQIGCRLVPGPVAVRFVNDSKLLVGRGMTGATGNVYVGLHEFEDMAFLLHFLRSDDLFVDVGANIGSYMVLACAVVGAKCVAFEPLPITYEHLLQNVSLNGIQPLADTRNLGLSDEDGTLTFTSGLDTVNHVIHGKETKISTLKVPVMSLDNAMGVLTPTLIKIDVEGFETKVIKGANRLLSSPKLLALIIELNGSGARYGFDEALLHKTILDYGFLPYAYLPFERSLRVLNEKNTVLGNTLYLREVNKIRQRVETSPNFLVKDQII